VDIQDMKWTCEDGWDYYKVPMVEALRRAASIQAFYLDALRARADGESEFRLTPKLEGIPWDTLEAMVDGTFNLERKAAKEQPNKTD